LTITSTSHTRCTLLLRAYLCLYARQYSVVKDLRKLPARAFSFQLIPLSHIPERS
jgi:hypothetical protein